MNLTARMIAKNRITAYTTDVCTRFLTVYLRAMALLLVTGLGGVQYGWCGYLYSTGSPVLPLAGPEITVHQVAAAFSLDQGVTVNGFDFWSFELVQPFAGYAGSIEWAVYNDAGGPGQKLASGSTSPDRVDNGSYPLLGSTVLLYRNLVSTQTFDLAAGAYWLGLKNGPESLTDFNGFFWAEADTESGSSYTFSTRNWNYSGLRLSYGLNGADTSPPGPVPEPSAFVLIGPAGAAIWLASRRRQKRNA